MYRGFRCRGQGEPGEGAGELLGSPVVTVTGNGDILNNRNIDIENELPSELSLIANRHKLIVEEMSVPSLFLRFVP
jgi:hypothetical protein